MNKIKSHILLLAMILIVAAGCSKSGNDDSGSLLRTIPADASSVVLINLDETVKSIGGKTDGSSIQLPAEIKKAVAESEALSDRNKQVFDDICAGETGISITSLAYFSAARSYVTGLLNDPDKFVAYAKKIQVNPNDTSAMPVDVVEENGSRLIGRNTVVIGNQFWVCTEGTPDIEQLDYYRSLNDKQSYTSSETAPLLLEKGKVVTFVADVKRSFDRMPESTYLRMGASLMFDDIAYLAGTAHFQKKSLISSSKVLNSKMKPADLLLPSEKIDEEVVKSLNKNGDVFMAAGIPKKLSKKISDTLASLIGPNSNSIASPLQQIDGTSAACFDLNGNSLLAHISTTGKDFASLSGMLQMLPGVTVTRDGDMLTLKYGDTGVASGSLTAESAAAKLKGAWIGIVSSDLPAKGMNTVARLVPDDKSVRLDIEVEGGVDAIMTAILK